MKYPLKEDNPMDQNKKGNIPLKILHLEDSLPDAELIRELLIDAKLDMSIDCVETEQEFEALLRSNQYDLILADFQLPGFDAFGALKWANEICPEVPFICISGSIGEEAAVWLMKQGAVDYVMKDRLKRLPSSIERALDEAEEKELRKQAEEALRTSEAQLSNAMVIAKLSYWEYDVDADMFTFNDHFYDIFRTTAEKVGGYKMSSEQYTRQFVHPDDMSMVGSETRKAIETSDPDFNRQIEHRIIYADGEIGYISVRFFIEKDSQGRTIKTFGANQDITDHKRAEEQIQRDLKEKTLLLQEIHHRTKNNLQTISSLMQMQENTIQTKEDALQGFKVTQDRIRTMAKSYEVVLRSEYMSEIKLNDYITEVADQLARNYDIYGKVKIHYSMEDVLFDAEKLSKIGLIINEIVTNSLKYAFEGRDKGNIHIILKDTKEHIKLIVSDDGIGIPESIKIPNTKTLGFSIVDMLMDEFHGTYSIDRKKGTSFTLEIPKERGA
jgi:two-component sensor histidine kinase/DNA-binding response OmpR family regulator